MYVLPILLVLLIGAPLFELYWLIQVGSVIGAPATILLCVLTAVGGVWLVRHQGFRTAWRIHEAMGRGELPALEMLEGVLLLPAGLLLLFPGLVTDLLGFLLLLPPLRRWLLLRWLRRRGVLAPTGAGMQRRPPAGGGRIIDGEFRREERPGRD
jgi:UPF0716 protein FxsA